MGLTQTESQAFWPLCNELQEKKFELNRSMRGELRAIYKDLKAGKTVSEADYDKVINLNFETKIKEAELEKTYYEKFRKILPADKVFKYQRAEQKFARKMFGNSGDTKNERNK
jgi:Spy/CpxP family protein refolding chaperone